MKTVRFIYLYKECDREVLKAGEKGNLLRMYEDKPMHYDCWDIDMYYSEKYWDAEKADKIQWEKGLSRMLKFSVQSATLLLNRKFISMQTAEELISLHG